LSIGHATLRWMPLAASRVLRFGPSWPGRGAADNRAVPLLTLTNAHLAYGHVPLLDGAAFSLEDGERVALIGRNGAGKSSLLKILAGLERADDGTLQVQQGTLRFYVPQEPLFAAEASVFDVVAEGVAEARALRARFEAHEPGDDLDALQTRLEALGGWTWEQRVDETLQRLHLDGAASVGTLSGGTRKRVALAQALVARPDVLLLDEPTNHLDLDAIAWLQALLHESAHATVLVSHDRAFIDAVATRIVELDRGVLRSYPGNFAAYEATKARELESEALAHARADKLLAAEEVWVRKGVEARRTRSVGRVARLERLRATRAARRERIGQVKLELATGLPTGKIVAELDDVSMQYVVPPGFARASPPPEGDAPARERPGAGAGDRILIDRFSATFLRGDKVGLVGPNGAGKTTLLKLILGELEPTRGRVRRGTNLQVAYFDQLREGLELDATLADTISPGSEWVDIGGAKKHVMSYLGDFLFAPERANAPVRTLSGGERNRLLLARLFALPANVIVLDEPTNDLDIETLELLEALLADYAGTAFLVSHDRRFVDNVVTSVVAWEGDPEYGGRPGLWREYEGGITDWLAQRERSRVVVAPPPAPAATRVAPAPTAKSAKLSYKEQRELDGLPAHIEALEAEQKSIVELMGDPALYARDPQRATALHERSAQIEDELMQALERWEALGARA
jgi:ATP-binding cassette subfamily F protein uup